MTDLTSEPTVPGRAAGGLQGKGTQHKAARPFTSNASRRYTAKGRNGKKQVSTAAHPYMQPKNAITVRNAAGRKSGRGGAMSPYLLSKRSSQAHSNQLSRAHSPLPSTKPASVQKMQLEKASLLMLATNMLEGRTAQIPPASVYTPAQRTLNGPQLRLGLTGLKARSAAN